MERLVTGSLNVLAGELIRQLAAEFQPTCSDDKIIPAQFGVSL